MQTNMIDQFLAQIQTSSDKQGGVFWSKKHLVNTAKTALGLLPSIAVWYLLLVQGLAVFLQLKTGSELWATYPISLIVASLILLIVTTLIARISTRAKSQNKMTLFAIALFGSLFLIIILPKGWGWLGVLFLGFSALFYWLTPWSKMVEQFRPISQQTGAKMAVILEILASITCLPYNQMRQPTLRLLKDFLDKIDTETDLITKTKLTDFAQAFSQQAKPLFGALSYRAKSLNNDAPELMTFMERYPPFPFEQRYDFNAPSIYLAVASKGDHIDQGSKVLWLKSAMIVCDLAPKTTADMLCDIELTLLTALLEQQTRNHREIKDLLIRFMQRLHSREFKLNVFQQNSWIKILELIRDLPEADEDIRRKWCGYDCQWYDHANSFAPDSYAYLQEREDKLKTITRAIWTTVDGSDTGPSLIGIKSDLWKMGCIDEDESPHSLPHDGSNPTTARQVANTFANELIQGDRFTFYELLKTLPNDVMRQFLNLIGDTTRQAFYQSISEQLEVEAHKHFEEIRQQASQETLPEKVLLALILRYIRAGERQAQLILRQIDEYDDASYIQDPERYEHDVERKLDKAAMRRVDQIAGLFSNILKELKSDIETANLDLQDFIDHLGYKFGALVFSMNACFSNNVFVWFLHIAQNKTNIIETEAIKNHYPTRIMMEAIRFHHAMLKGDKTEVFNALNQLFILHSI